MKGPRKNLRCWKLPLFLKSKLKSRECCLSSFWWIEHTYICSCMRDEALASTSWTTCALPRSFSIMSQHHVAAMLFRSCIHNTYFRYRLSIPPEYSLHTSHGLVIQDGSSKGSELSSSQHSDWALQVNPIGRAFYFSSWRYDINLKQAWPRCIKTCRH